MQKLFISLTCAASLLLASCSTGPEDKNAPTHSLLESIPIVYRPNIQQGNVVKQAMVNQLKPGMTKRQVRFLMGTPMLVDVFHQERWDYVFTKTVGWGDMEERRIALFFENDQLARLEGDLKPDPDAAAELPEKETVVPVPDWDGSEEGLLGRLVNRLTGAWQPDDTPPEEVENPADSEETPPQGRENSAIPDLP